MIVHRNIAAVFYEKDYEYAVLMRRTKYGGRLAMFITW